MVFPFYLSRRYFDKLMSFDEVWGACMENNNNCDFCQPEEV